MKTIPLDELNPKSKTERITEFIESIPDGEAVGLSETKKELGISGSATWEFARRFMITRSGPCGKKIYLVNSKTADKLNEKGE